MIPDIMAPRNMTLPDSDKERLIKLETQIGDSESGILGEIKGIKSKLTGMEVRLYGVIATVGTLWYALTGSKL